MCIINVFCIPINKLYIEPAVDTEMKLSDMLYSSTWSDVIYPLYQLSIAGGRAKKVLLAFRQKTLFRFAISNGNRSYFALVSVLKMLP